MDKREVALPSKERHLQLARSTSNRHTLCLIAAGIISLALGLTLAMILQSHDRVVKGVIAAAVLGLMLPLVLFCLARLSRTKNAEALKIVERGEPVPVTIRILEGVSGNVLLHEREEDKYFVVDDPAFGLFEAVCSEFKFKRTQKFAVRNRFAGTSGILYMSPDDMQGALVVDDSMVVKVKRVSKLKAAELQDIRNLLERN